MGVSESQRLVHHESEDFTKDWLSSADFMTPQLEVLARTRRRTKTALADAILGQVSSDPSRLNDILAAYIVQPWTYLAVRIGRPAFNRPSANSAREFTTAFGRERVWWGPIEIDNERYGYITSRHVPDYRIDEDGELRPVTRRWPLVVMVGPGYAAYMWRSYRALMDIDLDEFEDEEDDYARARLQEVPYWDYVRQAQSDFETWVGGDDWDTPNTHDLVLRQLFDRFGERPEYSWEHWRIRAKTTDLSFNTSKRAEPSELGARGIIRLARLLATSALRPLGGRTDSDDLAAARREVIRAMLRELGTRSYEFSLDAPDPDLFRRENYQYDSESRRFRLFKAHLYFATRDDFWKKDSLNHMTCSKAYGGAPGALTFLLEALALQQAGDLGI